MCVGSIATRVRLCLLAHCPTRLSDFGLEEDASLFSHSQWPLPQPAFVIYRGLVAGYTLAWLIMSIVNAGRTTGLGGFFVFLTNWTYIVLSLYLVVAFLSTAYASHVARKQTTDVSRNKPDAIAERQPDANVNLYVSPSDAEASQHQTLPPTAPRHLPLYFKVTWILLTVCLAYGPIISFIYWAFIFDPEFVYASQGGAYGIALTVHRHAFNTIFAYLDLALSAIPIRFWHFVYPCAYGILYIIFSLVYYWAGGTNPYVDDPAIYPTLLDWTMPGRTCLVLVVFVLVLIVFHSVAFGWYKLRMRLASRLHVLTGGEPYSRTLHNETHPGEEHHATDEV